MLAGFASPLVVVVLADVALVQCWTVGLFWKHGGDVDWSFLRAPLDSRYGAVAFVFGLYLLLVLLAHGVFLFDAAGEGLLVGAVACVGVGLFFLFGPGEMYPDVEEFDEVNVASERFMQDMIRGFGWGFLTVATTSVVVTRTYGPVVW
ncbi:hypothetical protein [Halorubellus salinus]|uniref:hypothetical protein n=1 Tax=Halorubellus salinus TaxID=755309 RepID=UPI001D0919D3|nr:hypothetical protein [Halorubellus salinus]